MSALDTAARPPLLSKVRELAVYGGGKQRRQQKSHLQMSTCARPMRRPPARKHERGRRGAPLAAELRRSLFAVEVQARQDVLERRRPAETKAFTTFQPSSSTRTRSARGNAKGVSFLSYTLAHNEVSDLRWGKFTLVIFTAGIVGDRRRSPSFCTWAPTTRCCRTRSTGWSLTPIIETHVTCNNGNAERGPTVERNTGGAGPSLPRASP